MIVFDLACVHGHWFEAWFNSSEGYADQRARGLIACPVCGAADVSKAIMAPRVAAKGNRQIVTAATQAVSAAAPSAPAGDTPDPALMRAVLAAVAEKQAEMLPKSRWVGRDFAPAARAMHEGRASPELIHGAVSPAEAADLHADGVAALPLLVPFVPPEQAN